VVQTIEIRHQKVTESQRKVPGSGCSRTRRSRQ